MHIASPSGLKDLQQGEWILTSEAANPNPNLNYSLNPTPVYKAWIPS